VDSFQVGTVGVIVTGGVVMAIWFRLVGAGAKLQTRTSPSSEPETIMSSESCRLVTAAGKKEESELAERSRSGCMKRYRLTSSMTDKGPSASTGFSVPNLDGPICAKCKGQLRSI
jgi:hypothetical protein